jgi:hypothetical protein
MGFEWAEATARTFRIFSAAAVRKISMKSSASVLFASLILLAPATSAQKEEIPKSISESVGGALDWAEKGFLSVAEAMPGRVFLCPRWRKFRGSTFVRRAGEARRIAIVAPIFPEETCFKKAQEDVVAGMISPRTTWRGQPG